MPSIPTSTRSSFRIRIFLLKTQHGPGAGRGLPKAFKPQGLQKPSKEPATAARFSKSCEGQVCTRASRPPWKEAKVRVRLGYFQQRKINVGCRDVGRGWMQSCTSRCVGGARTSSIRPFFIGFSSLSPTQYGRASSVSDHPSNGWERPKEAGGNLGFRVYPTTPPVYYPPPRLVPPLSRVTWG